MILRWFQSKSAAWLWLVVRLYVGYEWLMAGWHKIAGEKPFDSTGFLKGAVAKATGDHPAVQGWYAGFLKSVAIPNAAVFNVLIPWGEFLVGLALILGFATMFAALMGAFMNLNFMLAGSTSTNPTLFTLSVLMLAAGAYVGYIGVDYWFRPYYRSIVDSLGQRRQATAPKPV
ncbi:MAG: DoxX family protein [Bacillota bacterium]